MFRTTSRFLTAGLATLAVASTVTLSAPAHAVDRGCGLPAVDAVYGTVVTDPVFETVPAVTHTEARWARDIDIYELEFTRTTSPARVEADWSRKVPGAPLYRWEQTVVDSPAVPAVPGADEVGHFITVEISPAVVEVLALFEHEVTGNLRWEREDWGAQNGQGKGWKKLDQTKVNVITPAVTEQQWVVDTAAVAGTPEIPAVTHVESQWSPTSPGDDWELAETKAGESTVETATTDGTAPAGDGWTQDALREYAEQTETAWAETIPADGAWTGKSRVARSEHVETEAASATPPFGPGWTLVEGSETTVTDVPEAKVLVSPGSVEQVLVSPALPATDPCTTPGPVDENDPTDVSGPQAAPAPSATVSPATVLPNTGGVPNWMVPAGLAAMFAGALLVKTARRRAELI